MNVVHFINKPAVWFVGIVVIIGACWVIVNDTFPQSFAEYSKYGIIIHVASGSVVTAIGPFQLWTHFRHRYKVVHRWMGRTYLMSLSIAVVSVLVSLPMMYIHTSPYLGSYQLLYATMVELVGIAVTAALGYYHIRNRNYFVHRECMIHNYAFVSGIPFGFLLLVLVDLCEKCSQVAFPDLGTRYQLFFITLIINQVIAVLWIKFHYYRPATPTPPSEKTQLLTPANQSVNAGPSNQHV